MTVTRVALFPPSPKRPVSDTYHGVTVTEDYRWLENQNDPEVQAWNGEQNRYTRDYLASLPYHQYLARRLKELYTAVSSDYLALQKRGGLIFAMKFEPPKQQPILVTLTSLDDASDERVVLDPNTLDPSGATTIDFYAPSADGRLVAVSLSENGSEAGTLHVYDVGSGRELGDTIVGVTYPTAGGSVAWNADGTGIYYTRYPQPGERPPADAHFFQQVYFHSLGTSAERDTYSIGQEFPRIAEIDLASSEDGRYLLASVANGDGGEYAHYLLAPDGHWTQISDFADHVISVAFGDDALYLLSHKNAPRGEVLRLALDAPVLANAQLIIAQSNVTIQNITPTATRLYLNEMIGGPSQLRVCHLTGEQEGVVPLPPISSVGQVLPLDDSQILFRSSSFIDPPAWYRFDPAEEEPVRTALFVTSPTGFEDVEVVREFATSNDGTRVPLNIIRRQDIKLDGNNPTILYAYGGYSITLSPTFSIRRRLWLDLGGVYVVANLRGGGEYGEEWHRSGNLTKKQNVFDDFAATARTLIDTGYTRPDKLAIEGGSNGGLLMGAALTQRPELFRAVVAYVGIYDMLRVELDPNGAFNVTEFGSVTDPEQFKALYAYSPYHRVMDGKAYPACFFITGENDGRVNPAHSRKMTARVQTSTSSGRPVLLRTSATAGHGIGTSLDERIAQDADVFAFLVDQLEIMLPEELSGQ